MFGIRIKSSDSIGWIVGKDADIMLFPDKASAAMALKKMKQSDGYSWNCEAMVAEFSGWGKK